MRPESDTQNDDVSGASVTPEASAAETEQDIEDGTAAQANLEKELEETRAHLLRALAETENIRKRAERDRQELQLYAVTGFARDMLSVLDNLARAIQVMQAGEKTSGAEFLDGIVMTEKELLKIFEKHKITVIDALHKPFDPHLHQAMCEIESTEHPVGTVIQVMQAGYQIGDRLLRPAMVGVAKAPVTGA